MICTVCGFDDKLPVLMAEEAPGMWAPRYEAELPDRTLAGKRYKRTDNGEILAYHFGHLSGALEANRQGDFVTFYGAPRPHAEVMRN